MEDLKKFLNYINNPDINVNILNIFLKLQKEKYLTIFENIMENFVSINTYNQCLNYLHLSKYADIILYVKSFSVLKKKNINYIFFNTNLYTNINLEQEPQIENEYLKIIVSKKNNNSDNLIKFLYNRNNFITLFINKRNSKSIMSTSLWKTQLFSNEKVNLNNLNVKINFDTKIYERSKKNINKIKKKRKLEFVVENEKLISGVRLSLPNSFTISLIDSSYIYLDKLIISKVLNIGPYTFNNLKEKIYFILFLYKKIFKIDLKTIIYSSNISIKKKNPEHILYYNIIDKNNILDTKKINFSYNYINIKYITSYEELLKIEKAIEMYKKKYIKYFQKLSNINNKYLLYYNEDYIDVFL